MISINNQNGSFTLIQKIQNISFYPIHIYHNDSLAYPDSPNADTDPFLCDPSLYQILSRESGPVYEKDHPDIFYAVGKEDDLTCIIGPFCLQSLSRGQMTEYARIHHIREKFNFRIMQGSILQALDTLTLVFALLKKDPSETFTFQDETSESIGNHNENYLWFMDQNSNQENTEDSEKKEYYVQSYELYSTEKDIPHNPYELETETLAAFQASDREKFYSLLQESANYTGGEFASTSAKYKEYSAVSMITILTRASITGGVSPNDAYALSDTLLYKTSLCKNEKEYLQVFQESLDSFFKLVKKNNEAQNQSIYIRNCKVYISHHLHQELTPEILADQLGISKNYLLRLFPQYENITLMQYILRERVFAAANMLKYSDFSIIRIASYFQFQSQSHFGVVFKKYTGMSPAAYRKKYKPAGF